MYLTKSADIREPTAAAVHCAHTSLRLELGQNFMICDAGGGIVVRNFVTMAPRLSYTFSPGFGRLHIVGRTAKPRDRRALCTVRGQLRIYIPVRADAIATATRTDTPASGICGSSN